MPKARGPQCSRGRAARRRGVGRNRQPTHRFRREKFVGVLRVGVAARDRLISLPVTVKAGGGDAGGLAETPTGVAHSEPRRLWEGHDLGPSHEAPRSRRVLAQLPSALLSFLGDDLSRRSGQSPCVTGRVYQVWRTLRSVAERWWPTKLVIVCLGITGSLCLAACSSPSAVDEITTVVGQAKQVADDAVYLPVQDNGQWALAGPGSWLQPVISAESTPWRWVHYRCVTLDPKLAPGTRAFMTRQIAYTFAGALVTNLTRQLDERLSRDTSQACANNVPNVAEGPPGPIRDRTVVEHVSVSGRTASVTARVYVTDWQGGVTHVPAPRGGRRVGWATVPGVLNAKYLLMKGEGPDGWRVVNLAWQFAPGSGP